MDNLGNLLRIDYPGIQDLSENTARTLIKVRDKLLEPLPKKNAPSFTTANVAALVGQDRRKINQLATDRICPSGVIPKESNTRHFTLAETLEYVAYFQMEDKRRAPGKRGRIIVTAVFKGGVGKTNTTASIAQGLTFKGYKVLVVDADPQGSLTQLLGLMPGLNPDEEDRTLVPFIRQDQPDLRYAVQETYWNNLHIIEADHYLYTADYLLPAQMQKGDSNRPWQMIQRGLRDLAADYDVILIDTPPSLNLLTMSLILASDAILQPVPPASMDFASSTKFWALNTEMTNWFIDNMGAKEILSKEFDFLAVVPSRVKMNKPLQTGKILTYMSTAYGEHLLNIQLPESAAIDNNSFYLMTIYDQVKPIGGADAHKKFKEAMDQLVDLIQDQLVIAWSRPDSERGDL